jgi:hypothetical protein
MLSLFPTTGQPVMSVNAEEWEFSFSFASYEQGCSNVEYWASLREYG